MTDNTAAKIYEWGSYVLILAATVLFFAMDRNENITLQIGRAHV